MRIVIESEERETVRAVSSLAAAATEATNAGPPRQEASDSSAPAQAGGIDAGGPPEDLLRELGSEGPSEAGQSGGTPANLM